MGSLRSVVVLAALVLVLVGCDRISTAPPAPTPADFQGIAAEISKRGIVIDDLVSGDAGCTDHALIPTAISLTAYGLDQDEAVQVYLYIFRNRASFEKLRAAVDDCARAFISDAATFETIEQSPFVVASQGPWAPQFEAALRAALEVSAGTGN